MTGPLARLARRAMLALALTSALVAQPAAAQQMLRDSETEALFADLSKPLIEAAGLQPANVKVVLLGDPEINAFVAGGQIVYLQSGLVMAADNVNQLQGVIAHELGHVAGGHVLTSANGSRRATGISILSMLLGAAAMAAGAGDAGVGIMMAGQRAALGSMMAFTRAQESSADMAGAAYLSKSGISGQGSLDFFQKLENQEYRLAVYAKDSYDRTHPLSSERINTLSQVYKADPAFTAKTDAALEARFQRVKAKLAGFVQPNVAVRDYPEKDQSAPAHYARAYAYHVGAYPDKALREADALLAKAPDDPYFLELKGQLLLENGHPADAIAPLRRAVALAPDKPLIASLLGHALVSTEKPERMAEAKAILKAAIARDNDNPFAWWQMGVIYDREGDVARAALASAEQMNLENKPKMALLKAEMAMKGIAAGTPDYLRAQDIALVSREAIAQDKKNGKDRERE